MCSEPMPQERGVSVSGPGAAMPRCQPGPGGVHTGPGAAGPVPTDPGSPSEAVGESGPPSSPTCSVRLQPRALRAPPSALQQTLLEPGGILSWFGGDKTVSGVDAVTASFFILEDASFGGCSLGLSSLIS